MAYNPFEYVEALRDQIDAEQSAAIKSLYKDWSGELEELAKYYDSKPTMSATVEARYTRELKGQIEKTSKSIGNSVAGIAKDSMYLIADETVAANVEWLRSLGFPATALDAAFSYVPKSVVNSIVTGQVYGQAGSWNLSSAIWSNSQKIQSQAYTIVAQGVAQQMPIGKIAESLAQFVNPSQKLMWQGPKGMKIYGRAVDYASQRLARTLVQHTYQQSFVAVTKDNPFVEEYVWLANGSRACPICQDRDGEHYKKDKLPLDHPMGMCSMEPVIDGNMVDRLANWVNEPDGTYPEIDDFAKQLGYKPGGFYSGNKQQFTASMPKMTLADVQAQYGNATAMRLNTWFQKLPDDVKTQVKVMHKESGLNWEVWYQKYIYKGGHEAWSAKHSKVLSFDAAFDKFESKLMKATKDGKYLGQMSKDEFAKLLTSAELKKIGNVDDFVEKAFTKIGSKTGNSVSKAVKSTAPVKKKVVKPAGPLSSSNNGLVDDLIARSKAGKSQCCKAMLETEEELEKILTADELRCIKRYTGGSYHEYNGYYRELAAGASKKDLIERYGESNVADFEIARKALLKLETKEDYVLRRGAGLGDIAGLFMDGDYDKNVGKLGFMDIEELDTMFKGSEGEYAGFTSTSSDWRKGFNGKVETIIKAPKGTHGSSIMSISNFDTVEGEFLLAPGTKVKCLGIEESDGHAGSLIRMFLEIIV